MLRISKITDYGTLVLVHLARCDDGRLCPASDVSAGTHIALPTVQKVLKILTRGGLVESARGAGGGYRLVRAPEQISAAEILDTLEGPVALTECSHTDSHCKLEPNCQVGGAWQKISQAIRAAMNDITLADLRTPPNEFPLRYTILHASGHATRQSK
ncbi:MAG: SUF system Fe-S cluster assembly regulator [Gammaproteobacteria bacterium]|jgi:FeS assembly SUF system regulator|nr:SUF system Fe-S cluster assembly regulator [Chromatiales bacterium]MDP7271518.1 SUF system Fe-S cluster assembly regulator [Gammaproteobacteria bacterium]MDP7660940.1 SUF system Fe-S cluster assembly regulator [Gammaproteobacteria bacterium]HJP05644.1 SUF system Fe-S cluster assembly regulator [Gammaproteobacteria bacterium]